VGGKVRGASQIKTLSAIRGSGVHSNERHVHQFQIASLELERSRRTRERQAAVNRIKMLDERLVEIDLVMRRHQEVLGVTINGEAACARPPLESQPAPHEKRRTLRY
jgi:hypothetical protein